MFIKVQVVPESRDEAVIKEKEDTFVVRVREKPERGLANRRMLELLRAYFAPKTRIRLVSGHTAPHKIVDIA